ncbi:hypothetical protein BC939DRAFT_458794 [Gamsiella multidivaricata]|uniref:uncharacterized protein n=1 Tax=Gamsiella multidivaricata TaxID=101098 RepID=UPI002220DC92|nr:uncharacterized protein BC939DRAFT_458794 [Gamsiella multidivaricata]KAI7820047.1 hypothetical protein BC939DRAFT_458794 [Gamsiella multidivaricata]
MHPLFSGRVLLGPTLSAALSHMVRCCPYVISCNVEDMIFQLHSIQSFLLARTDTLLLVLSTRLVAKKKKHLYR